MMLMRRNAETKANLLLQRRQAEQEQNLKVFKECLHTVTSEVEARMRAQRLKTRHDPTKATALTSKNNAMIAGGLPDSNSEFIVIDDSSHIDQAHE